MILKLWPLAIGVAAAWLIVRWRDARALVTGARTAPAVPGRDRGAPAASGSTPTVYTPMAQFPGTFDEFSSEPVNAPGVPVEQSSVAPDELAPVTLVDEPPLALRDNVSAMPVAYIEDATPAPTTKRGPILELAPRRDPAPAPYVPPMGWIGARDYYLQPDHNAAPAPKPVTAPAPRPSFYGGRRR